MAVSVALLLLSAPASAQEPPAPEERVRLERELAGIRARLDHLDRVVRERNARIAGRLRSRAEASVEIAVGPFVVEGARADVEAALPVVREAWEPTRKLLGDDPALPPLRIVLTPSLELPSAVEGDPFARRLPYVVGRMENVQLPMIMQQLLGTALPSRLYSWSAGIGWDTRGDPGIGYAALLRSTHSTATRCSQHADIEACMDYLFVGWDGSAETSAEVLGRWYPTDAALEEAFGPLARNRRGGAQSCLTQAGGAAVDREGCLRYLADPRLVFNGAPSGPVARGSLLRFALERGGTPDLALLESLPAEASVGTQLEALSGIGIAELVREWRGAMTPTDADMSGGDRRRSPFALLWAGALALLGLRSTRWRLG